MGGCGAHVTSHRGHAGSFRCVGFLACARTACLFTPQFTKRAYGDQKCSCTRTAQLDYCNCGTPLGTDYETGGCCNSGCGRCDISLLGCPSPPPSPPTPPPALYRVILAFHFTYFGRMGSAQLRDHIIDHSRSRFHRPSPQPVPRFLTPAGLRVALGPSKSCGRPVGAVAGT